jgi:small GTP-binding protein
MATDEGMKYKVVFVGDTKVGKTSLIHSYLKQSLDVVSTLGATSTRIEISLSNGPAILNVWDTSGQEKLRNLVPIYAKGSHAAIIVIDQSEPSACDHLRGWYEYIVQNVGEIVIAVAANKSDLESKIDFNELLRWAADHNVEVTRTSALDGTNVEALFESVAERLEEKSLQANLDAPVENTAVVEIKEQPQQQEKTPKEGGCCK